MSLCRMKHGGTETNHQNTMKLKMQIYHVYPCVLVKNQVAMESQSWDDVHSNSIGICYWSSTFTAHIKNKVKIKPKPAEIMEYLSLSQNSQSSARLKQINPTLCTCLSKAGDFQGE